MLLVGSQAMDGWVTAWGCALQEPNGDDDPELAGATIRQTVRATLAGRRVRLRLSNEYGPSPLTVSAAALGRPSGGRAGVSQIDPGSSAAVRFDGSSAVVVPPGAVVATDPVAFPVEAGANLAVTLQLAPGPAISAITTHPGSRTTSHVVPAAAVPAGRAPARLVAAATLAGAVAIEHWYLLAALEVTPHARTGAAAAVFLGDSLTDGRGSTTDANDRWPDQLYDRLRLPDVGFVNQAAGGNRVLRDGLGIAARSRIERDVLACAGVAWLVLFEGVNDIGTAEATPRAQRAVGDELVAAYAEIAAAARGRRIRVYGATITPFGGHEYDDPAGLREATRQRVNGWIRGSGCFDAVLDFDAGVRDPRNRARVRRSLQVGDGLHLNPAGYRALAAAVPAELFSMRAP